MRRRKIAESLPMVALAALLPSTTPAFAQGAPPPDRWRVDGGDVYCSLTRDVRASQTSLVLRVIPGTAISSLLLASRSWPELPVRAGERVMLQLGGGEPVEMVAGARRLDGDILAIGFEWLPADVLDRLAAGGEIKVLRGEAVRFRLAYPAAASAVAVMRDCVRQRLAAWGVDVAAREALRQTAQPFEPPRRDLIRVGPNEVFTGDAGMIVVRATVAANGRVSDCQVVRSGVHQGRDRIACRALVRNGHYRPAIDADGRPAASTIVEVLYTN